MLWMLYVLSSVLTLENYISGNGISKREGARDGGRCGLWKKTDSVMTVTFMHKYCSHMEMPYMHLFPVIVISYAFIYHRLCDADM